MKILPCIPGSYFCSPLIDKKTTKYYDSDKIAKDSNTPVNLNHQPSAVRINFKGYKAEDNLRNAIIQFKELVESEAIKKIVFISHARPDGDAIGSMVAGKNIILDGIDKKADIFVLEPLNHNLSFLNPSDDKIICLNEILNATRVPYEQQIVEMFGHYDLAVVTDTPYKHLADEKIVGTILKNAKKTVKIDHHPMDAHQNPEDYYYGDINIIDETKESASQIIMQLVEPFGLNTDNVSKKISDALATGLLSDSAQLALARGKDIFSDVEELARTSNLSKIAKKIKSMTIDEFKLYTDLMNKINFNEEGNIAYFTVQKDGTNSGSVKNVIIAVLDLISRIKNVKYYFCLIEDINEPGVYRGSLRSNKKPVLEVANKYNGGGHPHACGITIKTEAPEIFAQNLINDLRLLEAY